MGIQPPCGGRTGHGSFSDPQGSDFLMSRVIGNCLPSNLTPDSCYGAIGKLSFLSKSAIHMSGENEVLPITERIPPVRILFVYCIFADVQCIVFDIEELIYRTPVFSKATE